MLYCKRSGNRGSKVRKVVKELVELEGVNGNYWRNKKKEERRRINTID